MTIARQFYAVVSIPFFLGIAIAGALAYQFAALSTEGATLMADWQRTARLNQELISGNAEQAARLQRQLEKLDETYLEQTRALDYRLGERYSEYLKLNIDQRERLAVERVRDLQSELAVESGHAFDRLLAGDRSAASDRLNIVYRLQAQLRDQLEHLSRLQMDRLQAVMAHMATAAARGRLALAAMLGGLFLAILGSGYLVRRRILSPVRSLLDASDRMAKGDLEGRLSTGARDELGQLAERFNSMAGALAASRADLERRVEERTEQVRAMQVKLGQAEKMSALGVLVGGVAHELNNPLAIIMGYAEMVRSDVRAQGGQARAVSLLEEIEAQVDRCRRIVSNLLQFARAQEPTRETFGVNEVVDQVIGLREYELTTRNTTVVRELARENPRLLADRHKLQQVLLNLLNNAQDAIAELERPGRIWIRTSTEGDQVVIQFRDDGPGFREPGRAFDPFYTTKDPGKGTGLGLSLCYGIVKEHGGEISAGNWERGAEVTVRLPACTDPAPASSQPTPIAPRAVAAPEGLHALVVDDEPALLRLHASFLSRLGISSTPAASGDEAIQYLSAHLADFVISDVRMPGTVDGVKLYEWVARFRPQMADRFIFVSGDLVGLNLDEFFVRTGAPRIMKPFRFEEYRQVITDVVERCEAK